jgi:hypothetical protein
MSLLEITQLLGSVGEFVGAIAVVVTLGYLAVQIRHARLVAQTTAIQGFFDSFGSVVDVDPAFIPIMRKGYTLSWPELSKDEQAQLHMYWSNYLAKMHMGYRLHVRGVLDHPTYIGFEDFLISALKTPGIRGYWAEHGPVFPADFRERLDGRLNDPDDDRPPMTEIHAMWSAD